MTLVGRPPVAGVAIHLFHGNEFGHAVADRVTAVRRELPFLAAFEVDNEQVLVAHEGYVAPGLGHPGVGFESLGVGQPPDGLACIGVETKQVKIAGQGEENAVAIRRPRVFDDAFARNTHAFPACFLDLVQLLLVGDQHPGVHQHPVGRIADVVFPQVLLPKVIVLTTQVADPLAVRRELQLYRLGTANVGTAKQPLYRQLRCLHITSQHEGRN